MKAGVLFPLSSFPSDFGIGDFGKMRIKLSIY